MKKILLSILLCVSIVFSPLAAVFVQQNTSVVISFGPFVNQSDGVTLVTSLATALDNGTTGIKLSKNGGTLTVRHATVTATTYDSYGNYKVTLDTTDTNTLGSLRMQFVDATTNLPVWMDITVIGAPSYDRNITGNIPDVDDIWAATDRTLTAATNITSSGNPIGLGSDDFALISADEPKIPAALVGGRMDSSVGNYQSGLTPLQPTVALRTLDVTSTGAAGIDWGNVENTTTTINFSGTTISAVSGAVGSVTGAVGSISGITFPTNFNLLSIDGSGRITVGTNADKTDYLLSSGNVTTVADAVHNSQIEGTVTHKQLMRLISAALAGKSSGAGTGTIIFRDVNDSANRITATVSGGNRTAITLNP